MPSTGPESGHAAAGARPLIPVAAGCLVNDRGEVLIAQRPAGKIAAGQWEFPGGKIEPGESARAALARELHEELGIKLQDARPLIRIRHDYSDRTVILDTWRCTRWRGALHGREAQAFAWVAPERLLADARYPLLAADGPIVAALRLPEHYVFTPAATALAEILAGLAGLPAASLLRLRLPTLDDAAYARCAEALAPACVERGLRLVLDRDPQLSARLHCGWHATAATLAGLRERPRVDLALASCHVAAELERARRLGFDAAVLGPVQATVSHPGQAPLGWAGFADLLEGAKLPVYAIGGIGPAQLDTVLGHYAQGCAGISAYWRGRL